MPIVDRLLSVACEGGGIDLVQEVGGAGRFRVVMMDQAPMFLDEGGSSSRRDSGRVTSWEDAVAFYSQSPWPMLIPQYVAPDFVERVLAAIPKVMEQKHLSERRFRRERWLRVCGKPLE